MGEDGHGVGDGNGVGDARGFGRRGLLVTGAAAALTLGSVSFASGAQAAGDGQETRTVRGTLPAGAPDFVYVPVEVPSGVREIRVAYRYAKPSVPAGTPVSGEKQVPAHQHGVNQ